MRPVYLLGRGEVAATEIRMACPGAENVPGRFRSKAMPNFRFSDEQLSQLQNEYAQLGAKALAARFGCRWQLVCERARRFGIRSENRQRLQGATQRGNNQSVRLDYFDRWTPKMAYILGYIWADGEVAMNNGVPGAIRFGCTAEDGELLRKIAAEMEFTGRFEIVTESPKTQRTGVCAGRVYQSQPMCRFKITSVELVERLMRQHAIPLRKSFVDPPFPDNVPDEMFSHFVRGNFDGDGCIVVREKRASVSMLGTPRFVRPMADRVARCANLSPPSISERNPPNGTQLIDASWTAKSDVLQLREWLYRDAGLFLARKREKFDHAAEMLKGVRSNSKRRRSDGSNVIFPGHALEPIRVPTPHYHKRDDNWYVCFQGKMRYLRGVRGSDNIEAAWSAARILAAVAEADRASPVRIIPRHLTA